MPRGKPNPNAIQYKGAVRVLRLDIITTPEQREQLKPLAELYQRMANTVWETWLIEHRRRGTAKKIKEYLDTPKADRGKPPFAMLDSALQKLIYRACCDECPEVNTSDVSQLTQVMYGKIANRKAATGSLPGSWAILLRRESLPSSTRPQPILVKGDMWSLNPPPAKGEPWTINVKVRRVIENGKGRVITDTFPVYLKDKRKASNILAQIAKIESGEWKRRTVNLVHDKRTNRWSAHVAYQRMAPAPLSESKQIAVLRPGIYSPWRVRIDGKTFRRGGDGREVAWHRSQLLTHRWSRQANYRYAGSANKGHGRNRALLPIEKLSERWKDFTKTHNQQTAAAIVRECINRNIGTLVYVQPDGRMADRRLLATAGKIEGRRDSTGWDWFQVKTNLASACELAGIHFIGRKSASGQVRAKSGEALAGKTGKGVAQKTKQAKSNGKAKNGKPLANMVASGSGATN